MKSIDIIKQYEKIVKRKTDESNRFKRDLIRLSPQTYNIKAAKPLMAAAKKHIITEDDITLVLDMFYPPLSDREIEDIKMRFKRRIYLSWADCIKNLK